ncbi:MAG: PAS domain S-box protein [Acidobacteriota bacterium]
MPPVFFSSPATNPPRHAATPSAGRDLPWFTGLALGRGQVRPSALWLASALKLVWAVCALAVGFVAPTLAQPYIESEVLGSGRRVGIVELDGRWLVQVDRAAAGSEAASSPPESGWRAVDLPATWSDLGLRAIDGPIWLRRDVRLPRGWRADLAPSGLALSFGPSYFGPYSVWVGDERVAEVGAVGSIPVPRIRVLPLEPEVVSGDLLPLAVRFERVGWLSDRFSAPMAPFAFARVGDLEALREQEELGRLKHQAKDRWTHILWPFFLALGLYHLTLSVRRRELSDYLWFGLLSVDCAIMTLLQSATAIHTLGLAPAEKLDAIVSHLSIVLLMQFLWPFLGRPIGRWLRAYQHTQAALAIFALVAPYRWLVVTDAARWLWVTPFFAATVWLLARESWRGSSDARVMSFGGAAVVVAGSAEMVLQVFALGTTFPLPAFSFALFIASMLLALSNRYGRMHHELDAMRQQLERMVEDRTTELSQANKRLQAEIAERQLAEKGIRMLERAVEQSIDGIAVADTNGQMQFINEAWARMHGYEVFELLGYDLTIFHTPEQVAQQVRPMLAKVRQSGAHEAEIEHRRRGGDTFPTWMTTTFLHDPDGEPVGYVFIARDITERNQAEQERLRLEGRVQQAQKLESLGSLAGGIAHDYNNILTGMLGNANLALQELPDDSPARERLASIEASAERAAELTDQLLAYAGEEQHVPRTVDLNELIREQRDELAALMGSGAELEVHLKDGLPPVDVDPRQVTQAIAHLLRNASDAVRDEGGIIMLRTSSVAARHSYFDGAVLGQGAAPGRYVFFEVSDTGLGMDDATRARMFDPFFSTKASGRGLGLAAVLGIMRAHEGAIKVYSQPRRGTTVEVLFPAADEARVEATVRPAAATQVWTGSGAALVIDDEDLVREVAAKVLQRQGFDVLTAADGKTGLELFAERADEIRLVLLDLTMPEMDGEEVFRELRRRDADCCVLLMSGYREHSATQGLEGLGGFLHKPFRPSDLVRKVREVLGA